MTHPIYTVYEARTRSTFLALMWAFSYPGRIHTLPEGAAFDSVAMTLLDLETSYFTPDNALAAHLATTGARGLTPERAAYHFYPELTVDALRHIEHANPGTMLYPDDGATLIISAQLGSGTTLTLKGAGIPTEQKIQVANIPAAFWALRSQWRFPMGWDIYLIDGQQVIGLPRSTQVSF
jgi:alpha-D-ribose 1-methylphosphonate 5-triphosphate synthase subunit PhnH